MPSWTGYRWYLKTKDLSQKATFRDGKLSSGRAFPGTQPLLSFPALSALGVVTSP